MGAKQVIIGYHDLKKNTKNNVIISNCEMPTHS